MAIDYTKRYTGAVEFTVRLWEEHWKDVSPKINNCIPLIRGKANQILAEINKLQLKTGEPSPNAFIVSRLEQLNVYAETCIGTKYELPKDPVAAMEDLERQITVGQTSSDLAHRVVNWEQQFDKVSSRSSGCADLVQGKARQLLNQVKQLDDISPEELLQARTNAVLYLDMYAARCLNEGVKAVREIDLPKPYHKPEQVLKTDET